MKKTLSVLLILSSILLILSSCLENNIANNSSPIQPNNVQTLEELYTWNELPTNILNACWVTNNDFFIAGTNSTSNSTSFYILNSDTKTKTLIFEQSNIYIFDVTISNDGDSINIYYVQENDSSYENILLSYNLSTADKEEVLITVPDYFDLNYKSQSGDIIYKDVNGCVYISSIYDYNKFIEVQGSSEKVYGFLDGNQTWSSTGEFFALQNFDRNGWDKLGGYAELRVLPAEEWPTKIGYDIFNANGELAFTVDAAFGENINVHSYWLDENKFYLSESFLSPEIELLNIKETIYNYGGSIYYQEENTKANFFSKENVFNNSAYFYEDTSDGLLIKIKNFETGEIKVCSYVSSTVYQTESKANYVINLFVNADETKAIVIYYGLIPTAELIDIY